MEILFADDCELFAESEEALQKMVDLFVKVSSAFAQEVSVKKTKVLVVQKCVTESDRIVPSININGALLENVEDFVYLGSKESSSGDMVAESAVREHRMRTAFSLWEGRVLMNPHLSRHLRLKFFNLIVVTNGIYGCATWNLTRKQIHDLESIQLRLLKKVCGLRADSRASYQDVMKIAERAGCPVVPLGCTIAKLQLRYLGHVERMGNSRVQRRILYGQLDLSNGGKRKKGAPARNYRRTIADALKNFGYSPAQWQELASDRSGWRQLLNSSGKEYYIKKWQAKKREEARKRHARIGRVRVLQENEEQTAVRGQPPVHLQEGSGEMLPGAPVPRSPGEAMSLLPPRASGLRNKMRLHALRDARRRRRQIEEEEDCVGENSGILGE
jgi:hypothetical protein